MDDATNSAHAHYQKSDEFRDYVKGTKPRDKIRRIPFGMSSFNKEERRKFGENVKLCMDLEIHHIKHWADGGSTSVTNGVCLCSAHHHLLHEGGYRIERVKGNAQRMDDQFEQQCVSSENPVIEVERLLRNSRNSFDYVRALSPDYYRFRVVDSSGRDIRDYRDAIRDVPTGSNAKHSDDDEFQCGIHFHPTREKSEPAHGESESIRKKSDPTRGESEFICEKSDPTRGESVSFRSNRRNAPHSYRVADQAGSYIVNNCLLQSNQPGCYTATLGQSLA